MTEAILCVDDELSILTSFQRQFRKEFSIVSALSGVHAMETLGTKGPFAVVLSDYNMPGMNGLTFLRKVREQSPDTIRLMLTGKADAEAGLAAINEGILFRFLTKPCAPDFLADMFRAALAQHHLVTAERVLRSQLVQSGVNLMAEMQRHFEPEVIARISRVTTIVERVSLSLKVSGLGRFDLAAMLSHVGCVGVCSSLLKRAFTGNDLSADEQSALKRYATIGAEMIAQIPGLESVTEMVKCQFEIRSKFIHPETLQDTDPILFGSQLLRLASVFDSYRSGGLDYSSAMDRMSCGSEAHDSVLLGALRITSKREGDQERRASFLREMKVGMLIPDNFVTRSGYLIAPKGACLSSTILAELRQHAIADDIDVPV